MNRKRNLVFADFSLSLELTSSRVRAEFEQTVNRLGSDFLIIVVPRTRVGKSAIDVVKFVKFVELVGPIFQTFFGP